MKQHQDPMNRTESDAVTEIKTEVLHYLAEHPSAADSVEGIRQWWLLERIGRYSLRRVQLAVDQLVYAGYLEPRRLSDGRLVYSFHGKGEER